MQYTSQRLIGRETESRILIEHIGSCKSIHIYGTAGSGKTALLQWICADLSATGTSLTPIYCNDSRNLRNILLCIASFFLKRFRSLQFADKYHRTHEILRMHQLKSLNINALRKIIYRYLEKGRFCIFLDHLENVTPGINSLMTVLQERLPVVSASRQSWEISDFRFRGNLECPLYTTEKLRIDNLSREKALLLMEDLYLKTSIRLTDKKKFFTHLFKVTKGNPGMIVDIFNLISNGSYISGGNINLNLLLIDREIKRLKKGI